MGSLVIQRLVDAAAYRAFIAKNPEPLNESSLCHFSSLLVSEFGAFCGSSSSDEVEISLLLAVDDSANFLLCC